jgi:hypothetical protein
MPDDGQNRNAKKSCAFRQFKYASLKAEDLRGSRAKEHVTSQALVTVFTGGDVKLLTV